MIELLWAGGVCEQRAGKGAFLEVLETFLEVLEMKGLVLFAFRLNHLKICFVFPARLLWSLLFECQIACITFRWITFAFSQWQADEWYSHTLCGFCCCCLSVFVWSFSLYKGFPPAWRFSSLLLVNNVNKKKLSVKVTLILQCLLPMCPNCDDILKVTLILIAHIRSALIVMLFFVIKMHRPLYCIDRGPQVVVRAIFFSSGLSLIPSSNQTLLDVQSGKMVREGKCHVLHHLWLFSVSRCGDCFWKMCEQQIIF